MTFFRELLDQPEYRSTKPLSGGAGSSPELPPDGREVELTDASRASPSIQVTTARCTR